MGFCARTFRSSAARRHQLYRRRRAVVVAHVPQALPATGPARFRRGRLRVLQKKIKKYRQVQWRNFKGWGRGLYGEIRCTPLVTGVYFFLVKLSLIVQVNSCAAGIQNGNKKKN